MKTKQELRQLVKSYYDIAVIECERELTSDEQVQIDSIYDELKEYFDEYNVDTIGDLEDALIRK